MVSTARKLLLHIVYFLSLPVPWQWIQCNIPGLLLSSWMYRRSFRGSTSTMFNESQRAHLSGCLLRLSPARQCRLATIRCGVGLSAGKPCLGLTSSCVQSCLPCVHVRERLSKGRLNRIAVLVRCKDAKPETVGSAFQMPTPQLRHFAKDLPQLLFGLRKCCLTLLGDVR